jgi:hypothetical protein
MSTSAPIALFVYRRTDSLTRVLDSLESCPEFEQSPVFIFSDFAKSPDAIADVLAVRSLVKARLRPNMTMVEAPENAGLARSIIKGVTRLCNDYGRAIVIEDDLIVSPHILAWFNAGLDRFEADPGVMQISGHSFGGGSLEHRTSGFLIPLTTSWGWATWKRAWDRFLPGADGWEALKSDRALRRRFDLDGVYPYARMIERQMAGELDSWAIRWYWSVFRAGGLGLFPPQTLVLNIGIDRLATHGRLRALVRGLYRKPPVIGQRLPSLPPSAEPDEAAWRQVKRNILFTRF